jgi:hypothetical protein
MKRPLTLLLLFIGISGFAQYYNDAQLWFNLYLEKKFNKKFIIHLNQQDRWDNNISRYGLGYADVGMTYEFTPNIKMLLDGVFTEHRKKNDDFSNRYQFYTAIIFKKDIMRWRFSYRNMVQMQYNDPYMSKGGLFPYWYDRNKFTVRYEISKRVLFYVAEELNIPLNNMQVKGFDRSRSFAGMFYNLTKRHQLEFYFMLQAKLQDGDWYKQHDSYPNEMLKHTWVYGVGYSIAF